MAGGLSGRWIGYGDPDRMIKIGLALLNIDVIFRYN